MDPVRGPDREMIDVLDPELLASLAVVSGTVGLLFPAAVSRTTRRAEGWLRAYAGDEPAERAAPEPSSARVYLTRLLGGWGVLIGVGGVLAPSTYFQLVAVGYALVILLGLWYVVLRSLAEGRETIAIR